MLRKNPPPSDKFGSLIFFFWMFASSTLGFINYAGKKKHRSKLNVHVHSCACIQPNTNIRECRNELGDQSLAAAFIVLQEISKISLCAVLDACKITSDPSKTFKCDQNAPNQPPGDLLRAIQAALQRSFAVFQQTNLDKVRSTAAISDAEYWDVGRARTKSKMVHSATVLASSGSEGCSCPQKQQPIIYTWWVTVTVFDWLSHLVSWWGVWNLPTEASTSKN